MSVVHIILFMLKIRHLKSTHISNSLYAYIIIHVLMCYTFFSSSTDLHAVGMLDMCTNNIIPANDLCKVSNGE